MLAALLTVNSNLWGETLTLEAAVRMALEESYLMRMAAADLESAQQKHLMEEAGKTPSLSLAEGSSYGGLSYSLSSTVADQWSLANSVHGGVTLTDSLPGSGSYKVRFKSGFSAESDDSGTRFSISPSLSASISEPLFYNGKIIDFEIEKARDTLRNISLENSKITNITSSNGVIQGVVGAYFDLLSQQKELFYLQSGRDLLKGSHERAKTSFQQGMLTKQELTQSELSLQAKDEDILTLRYQILKARHNLSRRIGPDAASSELTLQELLPEIGGDIETHPEEAVSDNTAIRRMALGLQQEELTTQINGLSEAAAFKMGVSVQPVYPAGIDLTDYGNTFTGFFKSGSSLSLSFGLGLTLSLWDGNQQKYHRRRRELAEMKAKLSLDRMEQTQRQDFTAQLENRKLLQERLTLAEEHRKLSRQHLEEIKRLFERNNATAEEVKKAELELQNRENIIWRLKTSLFLNKLSILAMQGANLKKIFMD